MTSLEIRFLGLILEKHRNKADPLSNCLGHPLSNFNFVTMSRCRDVMKNDANKNIVQIAITLSFSFLQQSF